MSTPTPTRRDHRDQRRHTVHQRVTVGAHFDLGDGVFLPSLVVYYDTLVPEVKLSDIRP